MATTDRMITIGLSLWSFSIISSFFYHQKHRFWINIYPVLLFMCIFGAQNCTGQAHDGSGDEGPVLCGSDFYFGGRRKTHWGFFWWINTSMSFFWWCLLIFIYVLVMILFFSPDLGNDTTCQSETSPSVWRTWPSCQVPAVFIVPLEFKRVWNQQTEHHRSSFSNDTSVCTSF